MFYDKEEIDKNLLCIKCNKRFDIPKILPCGEIICNNCEKELIKENQLTCPVCSHVHKLNENKIELPTQRLVQKLLEIKPVKVSRGRLYDKVNDLFTNITTRLRGLNIDSDSNQEIIRNYCSFIKDEIDIDYESKVIKLNERRENLINEVVQYEENCIDRLKQETKRKELSEEFMKKNINFIKNVGQKLKQEAKLNDSDLENDLKDLVLVQADLNSFEYKLKQELFDSNMIYIQNHDDLDNESDTMKLLKLGYKNLITNIDLEKFDKKKFIKCEYSLTGSMDTNNMLHAVYMLPLDISSIVLIAQFYNIQSHSSNIELYVFEINNNNSSLLMLKNHVKLERPHVELRATYGNKILLVISNPNGTFGMQVYDNKLNSLNKIDCFEHKPISMKANDHGIYFVNKSDKFVYVYDWKLEKVKTLLGSNEIENIYELIYVNDGKLIFSENTNTKLYVYCENNEKLIKTIQIDTTMSSVYVDPLLRLFRLKRQKKKFTIFSLNIDEKSGDEHSSMVLFDEEIDFDSNFLDSFCVTNNGRLVVLDNHRSPYLYIFA